MQTILIGGVRVILGRIRTWNAKRNLLGTFSLVSLFLMLVIGIALTWGIQQHLEQAALLQEAESR
jgi:hypothetical protein